MNPDPHAPGPASPAPYPTRGKEQDDAVRRRALPIAVCGVIVGVLGLIMLLTKPIDEAHPPAVYAVNLSFCAIMMGVGILFYARHTAGTTIAVVACIISMLVGFAGPLVYTKQTLDYRKAAESHELGNVAAIATAARQYAVEHGGAYPADLAVLLQEKRITPQTLHSPYGATALVDMAEFTKRAANHPDLLNYIDAHSDYQYFGGDLHLLSSPAATTAPATAPALNAEADKAFSEILVATARNPIMRINIAVAYTDGRSDFIDLEHAEEALKTANDARQKLGFAPMKPPESVGKALELEQRQ